MTNTQISQYDMLLSVENHFDNNPLIWYTNVPLTAAKTLLSSKIDSIAEQVTIQLLNPLEITIDKTALRNDWHYRQLATSEDAATTGKNDLYFGENLNKTDFERDGEVNKEQANLASYTATSATLSSLLAANTAFGTVIKNTNEAIAKRKAATDTIVDLLPETITILETRIDNLMVGVASTQPQFAEMYTAIRALNSSPTNPLSVTITTLNAVTEEPIANAKLQIIGEGISRVSSQRGYNAIQNLIPGSYQIRVTNPNYISQTVPFTIVSGETTELVVVLEPASV